MRSSGANPGGSSRETVRVADWSDVTRATNNGVMTWTLHLAPLGRLAPTRSPPDDIAGDGAGRAYRGECDEDVVGERPRRVWVHLDYGGAPDLLRVDAQGHDERRNQLKYVSAADAAAGSA